MPTLADLHRAVQNVLASKRLGTPVFVRYLLYNQEKPGAALTRLAQAAGVVRGWLNQPIDRVYATGTPRTGQVSLTLEFRGGATALLAWAAVPPRGGGVDLTVLGNRGAVYHDAGSSALWDEGLPPGGKEVDPDVLNLLERAVRSGRPETADGGAKP